MINIIGIVNGKSNILPHDLDFKVLTAIRTGVNAQTKSYQIGPDINTIIVFGSASNSAIGNLGAGCYCNISISSKTAKQVLYNNDSYYNYAQYENLYETISYAMAQYQDVQIGDIVYVNTRYIGFFTILGY